MKRKYATTNPSSLDIDYSRYIEGYNIIDILAPITPGAYLHWPWCYSPHLSFGKIKNEGKLKKTGGGIPVDLITTSSSLSNATQLPGMRVSTSLIAPVCPVSKAVRISVLVFSSLIMSLDIHNGWRILATTLKACLREKKLNPFPLVTISNSKHKNIIGNN